MLVFPKGEDTGNVVLTLGDTFAQYVFSTAIVVLGVPHLSLEV